MKSPVALIEYIQRSFCPQRIIQRCIAGLSAVVIGMSAVVIGLIGLSGSVAQAIPNPDSRQILDRQHTDAVSSYVDNGRLVLATKADFDGRTGVRLDPARVLFHVNDGLKNAKNPAATNAAFGFMKSMAEPLWIAPQVQQSGSIWPGFSTEDPNLRSAVSDGKLSVQMTRVDGPGRVEVFVYDPMSGVQRLFSSVDRLDPWVMSVPQHAHANWVFDKPGLYTLHFKVNALINGSPQSAEQDYQFYVSNQDIVTPDPGNPSVEPAPRPERREVTMTMDNQRMTVDAAAQVKIETRLQPSDVSGQVEFYNPITGQIFGRVDVKDAQAELVTTELNPGLHVIAARFIPTGDQFLPASIDESTSAVVKVNGEGVQKPDSDDQNPVEDSLLTTDKKGKDLVVSPLKDGQLHIVVPKSAGQWVSLWIHGGDKPVWLGWKQASSQGKIIVNVSNLPQNSKIVGKGTDGSLIGWDSIATTGSSPEPSTPGKDPSDSSTTPAPPSSQPTSAPSSGGGNPDSGSTSQPGGDNGRGGSDGRNEPAPVCSPAAILDHGHVDAFTVSASGEKLALQVKEDVTGSHVMREAEDVLFKVKESAKRAIPDGIPGAPSGYVLPLTQDPDLVWPGWDTNETAGSGYDNVRIDITSVEGPGRVMLYSFEGFGSLAPVLMDGATSLPASIHVPKPAHVHAQWVFTEKGIYKIHASAVAMNDQNKTIQSASHTYIFQVGDVPLGDVFCTVSRNQQAVDDAAAIGKARQDLELSAAQSKEEKAKAADQAKDPANKIQRAEKRAPIAEHSKIAQSLGLTGIDPMIFGALIGAGTVLIVAGIAALTTIYLRHIKKLSAS